MLSVNMSIVYTIINLLILYAFFRKFLFGRVEKILKERKAEVDETNKELDEAVEKAKTERESYETKLKALEDEKENSLAEWRGRGFEEYNRIISEAKVEAGRIVADARREADAEAAVIREKNQEALKDLVIDAAAKISARSLAPDTDSALYDEFIKELNSTEEAS